MSLACEPNKPNPTYLEIITQKTKRDLGLSPIFNVNTEMLPCIESFVSPSYECGNGMCEPITGLTGSSCLYNISEISDFDITFDFVSGSTMYTGYTGEFCYSLTNSLPATTIPSVCTSYSGITGNSITRVFDVDTEISTVDNSYRVRSWNKFISKCMTNSLGETGTTIDTSQYIDTDNDCYFVTVTNPPKPVIDYVPFNIFEDIQFMNETIRYPITEDSNSFLLRDTPIGSIVVLAVNGVTVSNSDYTVSDNLITIRSGITLESRDVLQAYYNKTPLVGGEGSALNELVKLEIFSLTGVTTGVTSSFSATTYDNFVNYNDDNNRLEIFLKENINPLTQPVLTINGVNVSYNVDFFKSTIVHNKLILDESITLEIGDILSIYYYYSGVNDPGDLGRLSTDTPAFNWSTQTNILRTAISYANMYVEITDRNDPSFNNIIISGNSVYNNGVTNYTLNVGPITTTSISNYIYRIKFVKNFATNDPNNIYETENYSDTGSFRLDWRYINNTKF